MADNGEQAPAKSADAPAKASDKADARLFTVSDTRGAKVFQTFPEAIQAFAKSNIHGDVALDMKVGDKRVQLAWTSWENDGSNAVPGYYSPSVKSYLQSADKATPDQLREKLAAAQKDIDNWPKKPKREAVPSPSADKTLNIHEGARAKAGPEEMAAPSRADQAATSKPQAKQVDDKALALPAQLERKYLRVGDDLFRSGRDEKPDMSIKGQDGIRINKDHAIGDAVAIAKHNGWQSIRVHGSDDFKKAVYLEAARAGVAVKDFEPSPQLKLEGERLAARDKAREAQDPTKRASMAKQDPTESRAAAEQFRRNSHRENATDPQFKAAQSHVLAASIEAKTRFPKKEDQARYIENAKETVAKRIENGGPIPAARFEQQRQNEAVRIAREDTVLRQQERKPSRSR
ncbi:LPD7 domain-containing protein [Sphingobium sp. MI1205]|uniref:LPD7 domain-containing protein n=1 Tax=Sphingobium sp. MI1205 TaxID=407020 RepID=UPI0000DD8820|nr:LPD7 domain-containing protein [Sphingobium sp. MI1205]AMK20903.1 putative DNA primase [Sphingobium sp. MI1205]BAF30461.1 putative DNA primase [uncultured bacterium]